MENCGCLLYNNLKQRREGDEHGGKGNNKQDKKRDSGE